MVVGLDKFKEAFADFKDNYVIIGGTACDIVLSDTDMRPPQSVYNSVMEYAESIEKELPSQSLQDALERDADAIQAFVDTLKESFVVSKEK